MRVLWAISAALFLIAAVINVVAARSWRRAGHRGAGRWSLVAAALYLVAGAAYTAAAVIG